MGIFDNTLSPSKKSEASLSPDKITSIASDVTSNPASWRVKLQDEAKIERMRKAMHRPQNSMQIDLRGDKKCKQEPVKAVKPKAAVKTPKRSRAVSSSKKTPVKRQPQAVRRNLSFDDGQLHSSPVKKRIKTNKCTPKKVSRTPKKGTRTPMKSSRTPMKESKTPKKTPKKQQTNASKTMINDGFFIISSLA